MQKKKPGSVEVRREQRQETIFRGVDNSTLSCMHRARGLPYSLDIGKLRLSPWLSTASTAMATPHADSTLASQNIHPQARPLATTTTTTPVALPPHPQHGIPALVFCLSRRPQTRRRKCPSGLF